jgi:hypothetical protein
MRVLWTRLLVVLAAAAFVALPAQPLVGSSYLCHMTGKVSEAPCCTGKRADVCHAQLEQQDCCELMQAHGQVTVPAARDASQDVRVVAPIAAPVQAGHALERAPAAWSRAATRLDAYTRPPGAPRFLANCSLLI